MECSSLIAALVARRPFEGRVALVVAHPDDETVAAGASMHLLRSLLLIHVTDGAPRYLPDAAREGFTTPEAYAAAREAELRNVLRTADANPVRERIGIPDQEAAFHMPAIAERLTTLFARHGTQFIMTHAYEGGHPDHDATAWAVHHAVGRAGIPVLEFAGYHAASGHTEMGYFLPGPMETVVRLCPEEASWKQFMFECFHTQRDILRRFDPGTERFRPAPPYDFSQPPHPGPLNYEKWGWDLTGAQWRELSCAA